MARALRVLRIAGGWAADYAYAAWRQARSVFSRVRPERLLRGAEGAPPILLLPGIYENWRFMLPLADRLHRQGHSVHVIPELGFNTSTIDAGAAVVSAYLETMGLNGIVIVAHSKGGLIGKTLMLGREGHRITKMIAIATPFLGSAWATHAFMPQLRAFSPRDPHTLGLLAETRVDTRITSVYADFDPHIPTGSRLPGAENIRLPMVGHFRILKTPALLELLHSAIDGREAATPEG